MVYAYFQGGVLAGDNAVMVAPITRCPRRSAPPPPSATPRCCRKSRNSPRARSRWPTTTRRSTSCEPWN